MDKIKIFEARSGWVISSQNPTWPSLSEDMTRFKILFDFLQSSSLILIRTTRKRFELLKSTASLNKSFLKLVKIRKNIKIWLSCVQVPLTRPELGQMTQKRAASIFQILWFSAIIESINDPGWKILFIYLIQARIYRKTCT